MAPDRPFALDAGVVAIEPVGPVSGTVVAPASKSVTNRLLVMAGLANGVSSLRHPLVSDDTAAMVAGLRSFGVRIELTDAVAIVAGAGGDIATPAGVVGAGLSGTTLRFLAALSLLAPGPVTLDGDPPLRRRPLGPLLGALVATGALVRSTDDHAPVVIESSGFAGGRLVVDAASSSQFATALLLVAPYASNDVELVVENLGARGYVEMTVESMTRWGASVTASGRDSFLVAAGAHYRARAEVVEYDASAAAHLFSVALATGGQVTVSNAIPTLQPDAGLVELFARMGAEVSAAAAAGEAGAPAPAPAPAGEAGAAGDVSQGGGATVSAGSADGGGALRGVNADLRATPDQLPTVAVLAALATGVTHLTGLSVARGHETDRIAAVATELTKLGADASAEPEGIVIRGGEPLRGGLVETYNDHRMAMAFSVLGAVIPGVRIASPGCVAKTYPSWWADLASLGVGVVPMPADV